jgi:predicted lipoprotein with Yx(FWY)xxD motif
MRNKFVTPLFNRMSYLVAALVCGAIFLSACASPAAVPVAASKANYGSDNYAPPAKQAPASAPAETAKPATAEEAVINVATDAKLGKILVGKDGMTLYMFTKDNADQSNCNADCLKKWPALITQGNPRLGDGVDAAMVGTANLADGSKIITYDHMPLYYWYKDTKAGDTNGQGVGKVWYVLSPDGKPVWMETAGKSYNDYTGYGNQSSNATAPAEGATLNVATDPQLGQILVGKDGMTLYIFTKDTADQSNCNAACLANWPPLLTQGQPLLGAGVDNSKVGTATLPDGTKIVTYNHMPLYYYAKDVKAGDVTGQGVGSVWFVISPDGKSVGG